jgi:hypothetical protein
VQRHFDGAPQSRDRYRCCLLYGPGSAAHRKSAALCPGHAEVHPFTFPGKRGEVKINVGTCNASANSMKTFLTVTAIIEAGAGLALLAALSLTASLLLGMPLDSAAATIARVGGAAISTLAYSSHGLNSGTPNGVKSLTLRVTSVRLLANAVAAKKPSITDSATPLRRLCAIRSPQCSATA